jgi:hypothetical protein
MPYSNRDRINLLHVGASNLTRWRWKNAVEHIENTAHGWEPVGLIETGGILVRHRTTGNLAEYAQNHIMSVNQRKAQAALDLIGQNDT